MRHLRIRRVAGFAIDPRNPAVWYVGIASGNVWKSVNRRVSQAAATRAA